MFINIDNLTIREATTEDAKLLSNWWNDGAVMEHAGFPKGLGISEEEVGKKLLPKTAEECRILIIEVDSKPIGEMNYRKVSDNSATIGIKICIPTERCKGYGTRFLELLIQELLNNGFNYILVDTNLKNTHAQHVYESLGFTKDRVMVDSWVDQLGVPQTFIYYVLDRYDFKYDGIHKYGKL